MNCNVCGVNEKTRNINIYIIGSEGCYICHECEMMVVHFINELRSMAGRVKNKNH